MNRGAKTFKSFSHVCSVYESQVASHSPFPGEPKSSLTRNSMKIHWSATAKFALKKRICQRSRPNVVLKREAKRKATHNMAWLRAVGVEFL